MEFLPGLFSIGPNYFGTIHLKSQRFKRAWLIHIKIFVFDFQLDDK